MTYDLLFMMILLGPAFLIRGDDGQDQLSITASDYRSISNRDSQHGLDSAMHSSSLDYDLNKNLSLSMRNLARSNESILGDESAGLDPCKEVSDCKYSDQICSKKDNKCHCPVGEWAITMQGVKECIQPFRCISQNCKEGNLACDDDGKCGCDHGFVPDEENIECVKAESTSGTNDKANSEESKVGKTSFPWYWFLIIPIVLLLLCGGLVAILIFCGLCVSCGLGGGGKSRGGRSSKSKRRSKRSSKGSKFRSSRASRSKAVR